MLASKTMKALLTLLLVASSVAAGHGGNDFPSSQGITCSSWSFAVETHNIINWKTVPKECVDYIKGYITGQEYIDDSKAVNQEAYFYARQLNLTNEGKEIWIFDVEDTLLSNEPYFAWSECNWGSVPYNQTAYTEWTLQGKLPVLPKTLKLYQKLISLGIKIVILSGRDQSLEEVTVKNLRNAGYTDWNKLITKSKEYSKMTTLEFKSIQRRLLVEEGYKIVGVTGDQWSDILGTDQGQRTFKLPNPVYYLP